MSTLSSLSLKSSSRASKTSSTSSSKVVSAPITVLPSSAPPSTQRLEPYGYNRLLEVPDINEFLIPDILPDLLDIINENDGHNVLINMIQDFSKTPEHIRSTRTNILLFHPSQKKFEFTKKLERDMLLKTPDVEESELYQCSNKACGSRKLLIARVQTRSADEALSMILLCTVCKKKETRRG